MQKRKENSFFEKFRLLDSQEHIEDIKWSSSDSSDIENASRICTSFIVSNKINNRVHRKRKRKNAVPKNISNLSITILDTSNNFDGKDSLQTSPILRGNNESLVKSKSPTFALTQAQAYCRAHKCFKRKPSSPVLNCKMPVHSQKVNLLQKSPILHLRNNTFPKVSQKVKKNLFQANGDGQGNTIIKSDKRNILIPNENIEKFVVDRSKSVKYVSSMSISNPKVIESHQLQNLCKNEKISTESLENSRIQQSATLCQKGKFLEGKVKIEISESQEITPQNSKQNQDDIITLLKPTNTDSVKRKESFFDNHFSSGSDSQTQHSISDWHTQTCSKSSDEVEIISIITQVNSNKGSFQSDQVAASKNPSPLSSQSAEYGAQKDKKIRLKKNGLAYRLDALIKKQYASVSLWQHERFLADNSNFLIPKGEHVVFLIQKLDVNYGCYLLDCIDVSDSNVLILISSVYVQDSNISENMLLKLYEPYKIIDYKENCKLIINVCKFECVAFNK